MSIVKITPATEKISCQAGKSASFQFNVSNASEKDLRYGIQVRADDDAGEWISIEGALERDLDADGDTTVIVKAAPPKELVPENEYTFRLRVYDALEPEDAVESATVSVEVTPQKCPKLWKLIAVAVLALLLVIGGTVTWVLWPEATMKNYEGKIYSNVSNELEGQGFDINITYELSKEGSGYILEQNPRGGDPLPEKNAEGKRPLQLSVSAVSTPNFIGKIYSQELNIQLLSNNFAPSVIEELSDKEPGYILKQTPRGGEELPGKNAEGKRPLQFSVSAVSVLVPNVVGKTIAEAENEIVTAGLELGEIGYEEVTEVSGEPPKVLRQFPDSSDEETRVLPASKINIVLAKHVVVIPPLKGYSYTEAKSALESMGLRTEQEIRDIGDSDPGLIINTSPSGGQHVNPGSKVKLFVTADKVPVPPVIGRTPSDARKILESVGLKVTNKYSGRSGPHQDITVTKQLPAQNNRVLLGSTVVITYPRSIRIPSMRKLSPSVALPGKYKVTNRK
ncbi:MAG: PASTA domain-containing protein [Candidatus Electrothrix scaldis]|nr:MAG: PASTA domain-containing protein [Candidatus Electrothrix sp. GW3-3]